MSVEIEENQVQFHPQSYGDPTGRVFWWQGELYRGVRTEYASYFNRLFDSGIVDELTGKGLLVQSTRTDFHLSDYSLVIKHPVIPVVSYAYEWGAPMLRAAALLMIDVEIELNKHGLMLKDAHAENVLFRGPDPVFVDLGSIVPYAHSHLWRPDRQFACYFVNPLRLMQDDRSRMARCLMKDPIGVLETDVHEPGQLHRLTTQAHDAWRTKRRALKAKLKGRQQTDVPKKRPAQPAAQSPDRNEAAFAEWKPSPGAVHSAHTAEMAALRQTVAGFSFSRQTTEWGGYYNSEFPTFQPSDDWTPKHFTVHKVLAEHKPSTVLDIGSAGGWYSQLAATRGSSVTAVDVDEVCIGALWSRAREESLPIQPLLMSFTSPTPGFGLNNTELKPATARLGGELILALAVVHHLVNRYYWNFERIIAGFMSFEHRKLLVEFVPLEDVHVATWSMPHYEWYNGDTFQRELEKNYARVTRLPSAPEPRMLFLCEKDA